MSADAFGNAASIDQDPDNNSANLVFNLRFPGQYLDNETGFHYNYFRDYDPRTGRYIESDPIGLEGGPNTYLYAKANPLSFIDPNGQMSLVEVATTAGLLFYGAIAASRIITLPDGTELDPDNLPTRPHYEDMSCGLGEPASFPEEPPKEDCGDAAGRVYATCKERGERIIYSCTVKAAVVLLMCLGGSNDGDSGSGPSPSGYYSFP